MDWSVFGEALECITRLRATNSTNEKQDILKEYADNQVVRDMLYYTYNAMLKYKLTKAGLAKGTPSHELVRRGTPFDMLEELSKRNMNNALRNQVASYIHFEVPTEYQDLVRGMVLKDLGIKMNAKSINKAIPNLIPVFAVALADPIKKKDPLTGEYKWTKIKPSEWVSISLKLNGVRSVNVGGQFYTRTGHEINGMEHIIRDLRLLCDHRKVGLDTQVFDGELIIKNIDSEGKLIRSDEENFRETTGLINRDDRTPEEESVLEMVIFDHLTVDEFYAGESNDKYSVRLKRLEDMNTAIAELGIKNIRVVPVLYTGQYSQEKVEECLAITDSLGFEGAMLNRDATYVCKRSKNLLKIKSWFYNDCLVTGVYEGEDEFEGTLGGVVVDYKGYEVRCGSGMNKSQRAEWWADPSLIVGKIITVKCKGESNNKNNDDLSMQFPVFTTIRHDKTEPSYES